MVMFTQCEPDSWVCRIDALEVRLREDSASITVFDDVPDAPPIHHCLINLPATAGSSVPASRNFIAAYLRNILRMRPRRTWDELGDLKHWPQPAARRFVIEPWRYGLAEDV